MMLQKLHDAAASDMCLPRLPVGSFQAAVQRSRRCAIYLKKHVNLADAEHIYIARHTVLWVAVLADQGDHEEPGYHQIGRL